MEIEVEFIIAQLQNQTRVRSVFVSMLADGKEWAEIWV